MRTLTYLFYFLQALLIAKSYATPTIHANPAENVTEVLHTRQYFYVGGRYAEVKNGTHTMSGQMYVEQLTPAASPRKPYPLVFVHGAAQTGTNWLNTPDGRRGWASYFLAKGYIVYIVDQTSRGRSIFAPNSSELTVVTTKQTQEQFTASQLYDLWPQAHLHSQWPGNGTLGDPIFDAFYAAQVQYTTGNSEQLEHEMQAAGAAFLDRVGDSILIMHSQAGAFPWLWADARPAKVKAIVAVEPSGPPFQNSELGAVTEGNLNSVGKPYGLTAIPLTYSPSITNASQLQVQTIPAPAKGLQNCTIQAEPAKKLANLQGFPVLLTTSQASYHAPYDWCTVRYLQQAGVNTTYYKYEDFGILGNGHLHFLEKNNMQIADLLESWIARV